MTEQSPESVRDPGREREPEPARRRGFIGVVIAHPIISATILACTLVGIVVGLVLLPEDWTLARKIAGGALGGAGCGLIVTAPRIVG